MQVGCTASAQVAQAQQAARRDLGTDHTHFMQKLLNPLRCQQGAWLLTAGCWTHPSWSERQPLWLSRPSCRLPRMCQQELSLQCPLCRC